MTVKEAPEGSRFPCEHLSAAGVLSSNDSSMLSVPLSLRRTLRRIFLFDGDVSPLRNLNSLTGILEDLRDHLVFYEMLQLLIRSAVR